MQTTVNLSENAFQYVSSIAQMTDRTIDEVIEETVGDRFEREVAILEKSVKLSSDEDVIALARLQMPKEQSARISILLEKNAASTLAEIDKNELMKLMHVNRLYDLRKGIGIAEAVERGLIISAEELA